MQLNRKLATVSSDVVQAVPQEGILALPEKVLQFGTGVLLRGLPDYFIDKANRQGVFNGRVVVVKSTDSGGADAFDEQEGVFTHCIRGVRSGEKISENIINTSISRVLSAKSAWEEILQCASNPAMQVVISNTTEVGITLVKDNIHSLPPISFPGKLLAFLYQRYKVFQGDLSKGMVIVPTELITDNGKKLEAIVLELAHQNGLEASFIDWLEKANHFCNSLVDRIVPGKLPKADLETFEREAGYTDALGIMSEVYALWAIEVKDSAVAEILSFSRVDEGVVIAPDIEVFRELKIRLLNGSHTFTCAMAHLAGFKTVKEAMAHPAFDAFIQQLMFDGIAPAITSAALPLEMAKDFAMKVLDRYRNPFIEHLWLSISLQYTSKMKMRNVPTLTQIAARSGNVPENMCRGFAAYILFLRAEKTDAGSLQGSVSGVAYPITDDYAAIVAEAWVKCGSSGVVHEVLKNVSLWDTDLSVLPGFEAGVQQALNELLEKGALALLVQAFQK